VRQPGPIAGWYHGAPYAIYATRAGHIALSLGSLDVLADTMELSADQRVPDNETYRRRDEATAAIVANPAKPTTSECLTLLEARGIWHAPINDYADAWPSHRSFTTRASSS
jgi:crotonobetainyl-CoA:carnitine CoA-transferase CaiB-like acyl-CoA transferase